jgi:2-dehydro-3-deoxyphosphogluconate aldolase/(4S)-4-hydroxy-2-oxoglutarate aldolase
VTRNAGTESAAVVETVATRGVVPVVELESLDDARPLVEALLAGGLDVIEITLRTAAGLEAIHVARQAYPEALVGAGTVRTASDATAVLDAGATFVVSPGLNSEIVEFCRSRGVCVMPGACTPTEVDNAVQAGADAVKFFPAEAMGGPAFLGALAGPFRDVHFVPTGGINAGNLADYLRLPQVIACGGSWMVGPALVRERRFGEVERLTREALKIVTNVRNEGGGSVG